jgi:hypothetical protein
MPTMQATMPKTQAPSAMPLQRCQRCGSMRATAHVNFQRNLGMLFIRRTYRLDGNLCKSCIRKHFMEFTIKNLLLGWWGTISLFVTPVYAIQNVASYVSAMRALRGVPE